MLPASNIQQWAQGSRCDTRSKTMVSTAPSPVSVAASRSSVTIGSSLSSSSRSSCCSLWSVVNVMHLLQAIADLMADNASLHKSRRCDGTCSGGMSVSARSALTLNSCPLVLSRASALTGASCHATSKPRPQTRCTASRAIAKLPACFELKNRSTNAKGTSSTRGGTC